MIAIARPRINARVAVPLLAAFLLAACDGGTPPGPVAAPGGGLPGDHPPVGTVAAAQVAPDTVLATAGTRRVTAADVTAALAGMPGADRQGYATPAALRELVESLADRRLMADAARAQGLDRDPVMQEMLGMPPAGTDPELMLAEVWLESELARTAPPGVAEAERHYREHPDEFREPARVRVSRVTAATEAQAEQLRATLAGGEAVAGADTLWLQDVAVAPDSTRVALQAAPGDVTPVLPAAEGYLVMRVEEKLGPRVRSLEEAQPGILAALESRRRQEALAALRVRLRKDVVVQVDDAAVAAYLGAGAAGS